MNIPEKIYLQVCGDCPQTDCKDCKFDEENVTWCVDRIFPKDVEYTRIDAFIEKAKKWFQDYTGWTDLEGNRHFDIEDFEDFRKYMEGE
jgi:hypothetical protein